MKDSSNEKLVDRLARSQIFRDYERAFGETTGLPLNLTSSEHWGLAHRGRKHENPFCAMMASCNKACSACLETQRKSSEEKSDKARTVTCFAGLCESSIPLRVGDNAIGVLQTGEIMLDAPTPKKFARVASQLCEWGYKDDMKKVEEAYFQTRVLTRKQYDSMVRLLSIFGQHLATLSNQIAVQSEHCEPPSITRAREYITEHQEEELWLDRVAKAVNMSGYYFCKMFKKSTGLNFVEYLARIRIEKAKNLLLNRNERVSEVAFEVGFQSITNFNRTFKKLVGRSPSEYREALPTAA